MMRVRRGKENVDSLLEQLQILQKRVAELEKALAAARSQIESLSQRLAEAQSLVGTLQAEVATLKEQWKVDVDRLIVVLKMSGHCTVRDIVEVLSFGLAVERSVGRRPASLAVVFTNTSSGDYSDSLWNFGDDTFSLEQHPSHTYNTPGVYTVTLNISGLGGSDTVSKTNLITVYEAIKAGFNASPRQGAAPLTVTFTNKSTGNYTSSLWDFGDGATSTLTNPIHIYTQPGQYTVSLTVSGLAGSDTLTETGYITIPPIPVDPNFTASPLSGVTPLTVVFTNTSTGDYTSSYWEFGDGVTGALQNPTHVYTAAGNYGVSLTINGPGGTGKLTIGNYINVQAAAPLQADFIASPTTGPAPLTVVFTNTSTGDFDTVQWNFGDGATSSQANPSHTYSNPGAYTAALTVSGPGGSDTHTTIITVIDPFTEKVYLPLVLK